MHTEEPYDYILPRQDRLIDADDYYDKRTFIVSGEFPPTEEYDRGPILVWRFYDAPAWMAALSQHGGDEDWLAYIPASLAETYLPFWLDKLSCSTDYHRLPNGAWIAIAAHS